MPRLLPVLLLVLLLGAGCGSDDDDDSSDSGGSAETSAETTASEPADLEMTVGSAPLSFDKKSYTAEAGDVTIKFRSDTRVGHNVRVQPADKPCCLGHDLGGTETINAGQESVATVALKPGKYIMYCSIGSHWRGGMKAKLQVNEELRRKRISRALAREIQLRPALVGAQPQDLIRQRALALGAR